MIDDNLALAEVLERRGGAVNRAALAVESSLAAAAPGPKELEVIDLLQSIIDDVTPGREEDLGAIFAAAATRDGADPQAGWEAVGEALADADDAGSAVQLAAEAQRIREAARSRPSKAFDAATAWFFGVLGARKLAQAAAEVAERRASLDVLRHEFIDTLKASAAPW